MANIPEFVREAILNYAPDSGGYTYTAEGCNLHQISEGLAAGVVAWSDGSREATVFYERALWEHFACELAPMEDEDGKKDDEGFVDGFSHHFLDGSDSHLGRFYNAMDNEGNTAIALANRLARMKKGECGLEVRMPEDDSLLGKLFRARIKRQSEGGIKL